MKIAVDPNKNPDPRDPVALIACLTPARRAMNLYSLCRV
jgi:hypothetical protein